MNAKLYAKLMEIYGSKEAAVEVVDLYAEGSLSEEMTGHLMKQAAADPELEAELLSLKQTVDLLHSDPHPAFTDSISDRILAKLRSRGVAAPYQESNPAFWQYHLPIQG